MIDQISIYQFSLNRQITNTLTETAWKSETIPANSIIKIAFPTQYGVVNLQDLTCNSVLLDFNPVASYNCIFNPTTKYFYI